MWTFFVTAGIRTCVAFSTNAPTHVTKFHGNILATFYCRVFFECIRNDQQKKIARELVMFKMLENWCPE